MKLCILFLKYFFRRRNVVLFLVKLVWTKAFPLKQFKVFSYVTYEYFHTRVLDIC